MRVSGGPESLANRGMAADLSHCLDGHICDLTNYFSGGVEGPSSFLLFKPEANLIRLYEVSS